MSTDGQVNSGAGSVRAALDEAALARWMEQNVAGFDGPMEVAQFNGGQSNPTYRLTTPMRRYVLRRKPPGALVGGAHDVLREARVLTSLADTPVPVPRVLGTGSDGSVIGTPFYVMEMVEGRIFWDAAFQEVPRAGRAAYFDAMNATIAAVHSVDPVAVGLADFGRAGNYFARQIERWTGQYHADEEAGRDPGMDALVERLPTLIPSDDQTAVVHGDFRCDNLIFHPERPEVVAVLDWELSTLGNPLSDFAYHALMYRMPPEIVAGLGGADPYVLGLPTEAEYVAAYCSRTGRSGIPEWDFYVAFNLFRLAAIFHGIKGRVLRGTASSPHARERAARFPQLALLARQALDACG